MEVNRLGGVAAQVEQLPLGPVVILHERLVPRQRLLVARAVQNVLDHEIRRNTSYKAARMYNKVISFYVTRDSPGRWMTRRGPDRWEKACRS